MPGFTQIPNEVFDDSLFTSESMTKGQFHSFLYRLAQFQPGIVQKRGVIIELEPGQVGRSQVELARISKRSLNWVRSTLHYLEKAGQIVMEKTNVSSTITLLKWVSNGTAEGIADGSQKVQQKDSRRYTNNIVNKDNTENIKKRGHHPRFNLNLEELEKKHPNHDWEIISRRFLNHCEFTNRKPSNGGWQNWYEEDIEKRWHIVNKYDKEYKYPWDEEE